MTRLLLVFPILFLNIITFARADERPDYSDALNALLADKSISLTDAKLAIDALVDPDMNREEVKHYISGMAVHANLLAGPGASAAERVLALKKLIYKPGPWNRQNPFGYDFDNPQGRLAKNKTLESYISSRKGNCVSMPLLFLAVADEMGVKLNITTAPQHMFIQFENPDTGEVQHLETTSGADPQRLVWQRKVLPMTDRAIESGMYMKRLTRNEMIAVMAETLLQDLQARDDQPERFEVADIILREFPQNDVGLLHKMLSTRLMIQREIVSKYPDPASIPENMQAQFDLWARASYEAGQSLVQLGWRPKGQIDNENFTLE